MLSACIPYNMLKAWFTAVERCIKAINGMVRDPYYNYGRKAVLYGDGVQRLQPYAMDNSCAMELVRKYRQNHE